MPKSEETSSICAAIKSAAAGKDWVSPRPAYVFATGMTAGQPFSACKNHARCDITQQAWPVKSVALRMAISDGTVKQYPGRIAEKYARAGRAAPDKLELYYRAVEDGYLPLLP